MTARTTARRTARTTARTTAGRFVAAGLLACELLVTAACGGGSGTVPAGQPRRPVVEVLLPASMEPVADALADAVATGTPGLDLRVRTGGSTALAASVVAGAPADVLVVAGPAVLRPVLDAGLVDGQPRVVARNGLVLVAPRVPAASAPGRPVRGAADLAREDLVVAVCDVAVPCGALAEEAAARAGVRVAADTREPDVRAVLQRVRGGEADLGAVYATDARDAPELRLVGLHPTPTTSYPAVVLRDAQDPVAARAVVDALAGPAAAEVLHAAGFG